MRVAWIVPGFSADESDWCIPALLNLARAASQRVELDVFALRYPHRRGTYRIGHATVHSLGWAQRRGTHSARLWFEAVRLIMQRHRQQPFDVLHAFWADEPGWIGAACARRLGLPLVISLAGGELSDLPQIGYGLQRHLIQRQFIRWALLRATRVTAGSQYYLDIARAQGITNLSLAPLGVDTRLFCPQSNFQLPTSNLQLPTPNSQPPTPNSQLPTPNLINVGSLLSVKGQITLLHAMHRVAATIPSARLQIVGEGPLKNELSAAIRQLGLSEHVVLRAAVAHDQLPALYRAADLFVQSSLHEAQGMAVLEAAACGVPCVGTRVGVVRELAPDAARATPVGDEHALAEPIIELLRDDKTRITMGRAARARVEEFYDVEKCVERFVALYGSR